MRILFLSHKFSPDIGGIESISEVLATAFSKAGHEVHLITWSKGGNDQLFPFQISRNPGIVKLFQLHAKADLVFENNPCIRLGWPALFFNRPSIIGLQTWISPLGHKVDIAGKLKYQWLKRAKAIIACSEAIKKHCNLSATVIGNPYNEKLFKRIPSIEKKKDFIFLGRLVSDKGVELAIKTFHKLILLINNDNSLTNALPTLTIIGDGEEKNKLEQLVVNLGIQSRVIFTGSLRGDQLVKVLNEHRFILVPSVWEEPFGIVALEGMACGCVPIVSKAGGLPDAIGNAGLIFKKDDIDSFVGILHLALKNKNLIDKLQQSAPDHLYAHTSKEISAKYLSVINQVVEKEYGSAVFNF